jgi:hypothetical protein
MEGILHERKVKTEEPVDKGSTSMCMPIATKQPQETAGNCK